MQNDFHRGRRTRRTAGLRALVRETDLSPRDLVQPYFVIEGHDRSEPIESMPGISRLSIDRLVSDIRQSHQGLGLDTVILFGVPDETNKNEQGSGAWQSDGLIQRAVSTVKSAFPDLVVITDVCLCGYTDHGHCGQLNQQGNIDNDTSLGALAQMALSHAQAGADIVAPSDMMDGRVAAIRATLDESGFSELPILSYAAKYASGFYGPFRDAANSLMTRGESSRASYQMDPHNIREALRELEADVCEGADLLMIKPALAYLDVIRAARERFDLPITAYSVSGEYSMVKAAGEKGWLDEQTVVTEMLTAIKRAGADRILTYWAKDFAAWSNQGTTRG